ncbi:MAG: alpha-L-fucosidase [Gemmatimonadota bacterium]|nr:alpha-L-fucosidase [Gemmatimonadota bacterium]
MLTRSVRLVALALALGTSIAHAQSAAVSSAYVPSAENVAARQWYQDAKLGMFIHWGISSVLQDGEWVMNNRGITASDYESIAPHFNPQRFDAAAWVRTAKAAGMKYITLITKHHDGIALWDSQVSDWTIPKHTPYARDIVRQLADECRRQDIKLFFYYSQLDWHHPDYWPRGTTGKTAGRPERGDWPRYLAFMDAQLTELLSNYGPIGGIWFDGMWDKPEAPWQLDRTYALIHRLQPAALIIPNHHGAPLPGEDVQTFERDLPGANTAGFNTTTIGALPLETSETTNDSWGFRLHDNKWKPIPTLIRELAEAAGRNANFLLNVGPRPDGTIPDSALVRLAAIGNWMTVNGASIYGTRGGPVAPRRWGVTTQKGDTVYVHLLDTPDRVLALPPLPKKVARAYLLADQSPVAVVSTADGITLTLPRRDTTTPDQVIVLVLGAK